MNTLHLHRPDGSEARIALPPQGALVIGRDPDNALVLEDPQVSWRHARIDCTAQGCLVEDLHSTNGTFVDDTPISRQALVDGAVLGIGPYRLVFQAGQETPSASSSSEQTLFSSGADHPHQIDPIQDPYATRLTAVQPGKGRTPPRSTRGADVLGRKTRRGWPILDWLSHYRMPDLRGDLSAGLTVAALMVPQGMAYAMLAGLPPVSGLYASVLPMILYALSGSSRQVSVAPVALDSILVLTGVSVLAQAGSQAFVGLAILLAAMVGGIQLLMGVLGLGFVVNLLSYPVLTGFTAAAAMLIAFSQLPHLLGVAPSWVLAEWLDHPLALGAQIHPWTLGIALVSILALTGLKRWAPRLPGPLLVLGLAAVAVWLGGLDERGVQIVGEIPSGLPQLGLPPVDPATLRELAPLALTLALVGFAQTVAIGKTLAQRQGRDIRANQELIALGLSNLASGLSQAFPVSGGLSRSMVNAKAGARTPMAALITAALVAGALVWLAPAFHYLPKAALAALILVSAVGLIDLAEIRYLFRVKKTEGGVLAFTFLATLTLGIAQGLAAGVIASILLFMGLNTRPNTALLGRLPGTDIFRNVDNFPEAQTLDGVAILRIDSALYFANTEFLKARFRALAAQPEGRLRAIVLDASAVSDLDSSADTALHQICAELRRCGIELYIAGIKSPVREVMKRSGLYQRLGGDHFFFTVDAAVKRLQGQGR